MCEIHLRSIRKKKYGGKWCAILMPRGYGSSYFTYYDDCYISLIMGEFRVTIFKSNRGD